MISSAPVPSARAYGSVSADMENTATHADKLRHAELSVVNMGTFTITKHGSKANGIAFFDKRALKDAKRSANDRMGNYLKSIPKYAKKSTPKYAENSTLEYAEKSMFEYAGEGTLKYAKESIFEYAKKSTAKDSEEDTLKYAKKSIAKDSEEDTHKDSEENAPKDMVTFKLTKFGKFGSEEYGVKTIFHHTKARKGAKPTANERERENLKESTSMEAKSNPEDTKSIYKDLKSTPMDTERMPKDAKSTRNDTRTTTRKDAQSTGKDTKRVPKDAKSTPKTKSASRKDNTLVPIFDEVPKPGLLSKDASQTPPHYPPTLSWKPNNLTSKAPPKAGPIKPIESEDLNASISTKGVQGIDDKLTVNFDADVPGLQSQIYRIGAQLKELHPQIDLLKLLPYKVWKSENREVLKTYLKIMVRRWEARSEFVRGHYGDDLDGLHKYIVNVHNITEESAQRMAKRYEEIGTRREKTSGQAAGSVDWGPIDMEEFEAAVSWLKPAESSQQVPHTQEQPEIPIVTGRSFSKASFPRQSIGHRTQRHYSTRTSDAKSPQAEDTKSALPTALPHLTSSGSAHMVSVSEKANTVRTAIAVGVVHFSNPTPLSLIRSNSLKKGDVLSVARIAGIMAAKSCPTLIPLCHPIALSHIGVSLRLIDDEQAHGGVEVQVKVQCTGPTGVEMEALTAVMGAALTVVDMCKAVDKAMRVQDVRVVRKEGGRSGAWIEEGYEVFEESG